ncbi:MAG: hypothetical protein WC552_09380 [Candidatus Omnitrophota bacterium]
MDTEVKWEGNYSIRISVPDPGNSSGEDRESLDLEQSLPILKADTEYRISFYIKTKSIEPYPENRPGWPMSMRGACVNIWAGGNNWFPAPSFTGTKGWTKQGFIFKTPKDMEAEHLKPYRSYIRVRLIYAFGTVWFDDSRLEEIVKAVKQIEK